MFKKLKEYQVEGQKVYFSYEGDNTKVKPCVEVISERIVNVFIDYTGRGHRSRAIEGELGERINAGKTQETGKLESVSWDESGVIIRTSKLTVIVSDNFCVDFYDHTGMPLSLAYRGDRKRKGAVSSEALTLLAKEGHASDKVKGGNYQIQELRALGAKDCIYGLGDKTGVLNKRYYEYEMWNSDLPEPQEDNFKALYKSIPFMLVLKEKGVYGIFFDNHN